MPEFSILHSIFLGIVEGLTEFLPISSTGHLILLNNWTGEFAKSFDIIIQLGAILAVVVLYWKKLWQKELLKKLFVAFLPTAIIGLALYKVVKTYLLENKVVVLWALLLGGVALIVFEIWHKEKENAEEAGLEAVSYKQSFLIGLFQSIAIIPGVSRSASTIVGGLSLGLNRKTIVEFSFLLAVPTMLAASALDLFKNAGSFSTDQTFALITGFLVSFVVAILAIKFLLQFVKNHTFIPFGVYRILIAILFWIFLI